MISLDFLISIGSLGLGVSTLPGLLNKKSQFPRWKSSFITAFFLTYFIPLFYFSGLTFTAATLFVQAATWWLIFWFRPIRKTEQQRTIEELEVIIKDLKKRTERVEKREAKKNGKADPEPDERLFQ